MVLSSFFFLSAAHLLMLAAWSPVGSVVLKLHCLVREALAVYKVELEVFPQDKVGTLTRAFVLTFKCGFLFLGSLKFCFCLLTGPLDLHKESFLI